jgi:uncharacterized protein (TIGR02284 family)
MATRDDAIATLNHLIETCRDGEEGFRTAAESVGSARLRRLFESYAEQRARFAAELEAAVHALGGQAQTTGSIAGAVHRGWMNVKSAVTGRDDAAVVAAAERGEDVAVKAYERALTGGLPDAVQPVVARQLADIRAVHDRVRELERAA